jgi:ribosomal protein L29
MVKALLRRLRAFLYADVTRELDAIRGELAELRAALARGDDLAPLVRQMENALLTIALNPAEAAPRGRSVERD